jgi:hypothetical protein
MTDGRDRGSSASETEDRGIDSKTVNKEKEGNYIIIEVLNCMSNEIRH